MDNLKLVFGRWPYKNETKRCLQIILRCPYQTDASRLDPVRVDNITKREACKLYEVDRHISLFIYRNLGA